MSTHLFRSFSLWRSFTCSVVKRNPQCACIQLAMRDSSTEAGEMMIFWPALPFFLFVHQNPHLQPCNALSHLMCAWLLFDRVEEIEGRHGWVQSYLLSHASMVLGVSQGWNCSDNIWRDGGWFVLTRFWECVPRISGHILIGIYWRRLLAHVCFVLCVDHGGRM